MSALKSQKPPKATRKGALLVVFLLLLGGFIFLLVVWPSPKSTKIPGTVGDVASHPAIANPRPQVAPPKYRILYQRGAYPTTIAVPVGTTDVQLKSLLWHIRDQIRSHSYKELGLNAPSDRNHQYVWGTIEIYRGTRCAPEEYTEHSPCGTSDHDAGWYTWDMSGNHDDDQGVIVTADKDVQVFDGSDGYQLPSDLKAKLDAKVQAAAAEEQAQKAAQQLLASAMQESLQQAGYDANIFAGPEKGQLVIGSDIFKNDFGRAEFLSDALPKLKNGLCKAGFTNVILKSGLFLFGHTYRLGC